MHRRSYMNAYVLLTLSNELGKIDKIARLPVHFYLFFPTSFIKFINEGARMFITCHQHYLKSHFGDENLNVLPFFTQRYNKVMLNLLTTSCSTILLHVVKSLTDATSCDKCT